MTKTFCVNHDLGRISSASLCLSLPARLVSLVPPNINQPSPVHRASLRYATPSYAMPRHATPLPAAKGAASNEHNFITQKTNTRAARAYQRHSAPKQCWQHYRDKIFTRDISARWGGGGRRRAREAIVHGKKSSQVFTSKCHSRNVNDSLPSPIPLPPPSLVKSSGFTRGLNHQGNTRSYIGSFRIFVESFF